MKKAVKARLSGAISTNSPKNKKIVFGDDGIQTQNNEIEAVENDDVSDKENSNEDENDESESGDDDDAVEEVKGSAARESTQRLRESERMTAKDSMSKKKRKKKDDVAPAADAENDDESSESENENEAGDDLLTENFFTKVDSERADKLQQTKKEEKMKRVQQKQKRLGKHTTFVAEGGYKMTDTPHKKDQNIEVVTIGYGETSESTIMSATLGTAPSKAAIAFARGSMTCGTSKERGSDSRKRKSKNEETWKRSRKVNTLGIGSRPGQAATLFVRKR